MTVHPGLGCIEGSHEGSRPGNRLTAADINGEAAAAPPIRGHVLASGLSRDFVMQWSVQSANESTRRKRLRISR